eukprot:6642123-Pyramimonas_sp.AAC.1
MQSSGYAKRESTVLGPGCHPAWTRSLVRKRLPAAPAWPRKGQAGLRHRGLLVAMARQAGHVGPPAPDTSLGPKKLGMPSAHPHAKVRSVRGPLQILPPPARNRSCMELQ